MTIHLIDYLSFVTHSEISDLKRLPARILLYNIEKIPASSCSAEEWDQCSNYLFSCASPARLHDSGQAKKFLVKELQHRC